MLSMENSGAALGGRPIENGDGMKTMRVRAVRGFVWDWKDIAPGTVVDLPVLLAGDLIAGGRAEVILDDLPALEAQPEHPAKKGKTQHAK